MKSREQLDHMILELFAVALGKRSLNFDHDIGSLLVPALRCPMDSHCAESSRDLGFSILEMFKIRTALSSFKVDASTHRKLFLKSIHIQAPAPWVDCQS